MDSKKRTVERQTAEFPEEKVEDRLSRSGEGSCLN